MKKKSGKRRPKGELQPEYDLSKLKGGVRGKYYRQAIAAKNQILSEITASAIKRKDAEVGNSKNQLERKPL